MNTIDLFKSFSEPIRLRILHLLSHTEPELCVCDLVSVLGSPQGTISRHLMHLRLVGLVEDRREGVWVYYRLSPAKSKAHAALLNCLRSCFDEDPGFADDLQQYATLKKRQSLACCVPQSSQGRSASPKLKAKANVKL